VKIRKGGLKDFEQRVLDGDVRALRALVRQASGPNTLDLPFQAVELRAKGAGKRLLFTGYASVVDVPYVMCDWLGEYTEIIRGGAYTKTLAENPDDIFCVNHLWGGVPMARTIKAETLRLAEDSTGLAVEADLDGSRSDVYQLQSAMEAGELDAMSFAFYVTKQMWSPDYAQRDIEEVDLDGGDVSVVTWPANPATTGTTALRAASQGDLRKQAGLALARSSVPALIVERARAEKRAGAKLSTSTMNTLQEVLDLIAEADVAVDAAQVILSELMGVPNPDDDGNDETSSSAGGDTSETNSAERGHLEAVRLRQRQAAAAGR
jgi:HK97 family phage prohead protease